LNTMQSIGKKMAKGAAWLMLFTVLQRCLGLVSTIILARLLVPADFGLVAMGTSIFAGLEIVSTFSFDLALIQNQKAERKHYDTAWTFTVIFAFVNAMAMAALAIPVSEFFGEPRLVWVMYALALCALVSGFDNIGVVAFQKDLELHKEFRLGMTKKLVGFGVTVIFAYLLRSYWALIAGMFAGRVTAVALSYWLHPYRPRFSLLASGELFHFSKWLLINNILIFVNNRGVDFVVGKVAGTQALGLYSVAYEISNLPTTELVFPISRAVFPGYSKLAGDVAALRAAFLDVISLIAIITVPAGCGIGLVAEPLVFVVLGDKWVDSIALMQVLAIFGVVRALSGPTGSVYLALAKPQLISYLHSIHILVAVPMLIWLMNKYSVLGAPWAILTAAAVSFPINYIWLMRALKLSFLHLAAALWRPMVAAALMVAVGTWVQHQWLIPMRVGQSLAGLLILMAVGALVYIASVLALWKLARCPHGAESRLVALLNLQFIGTG
jgi:lipopolysaccharide exporter